ncbi:MAG: hypothetical protein ABI240_05830 [Sphingomonas sp.]
MAFPRARLKGAADRDSGGDLAGCFDFPLVALDDHWMQLRR